MSDNNQILLKILEKFTEFQTDMKDMKTEINNIKKRKSPKSNCNDISTGQKIVEIKSEKLNIPEKFIRKCIKYGSIRGDMLIIKHWYIDNSDQPPIRYINSKRWDFWCNGKWNIDFEGEYIKDVISKNIQRAYLSVNTIDYYEDNYDQFLDNQKHIQKLSDKNYKKKILNGIKELLKADIIS
jgi:hypothetical protein